MSTLSSHAQIGYQLAVLDQETGTPKRNAAVSVAVTISDSKGNTIFSNTYDATTNDFGMVSLQVGNTDTFTDTDWENLPLFIGATIDGTIEIGKSQILNVPVAEYAKKTGVLTKEILCSKTWVVDDDEEHYATLNFYMDGTVIYRNPGNKFTDKGKYEIDGNFIDSDVKRWEDGFTCSIMKYNKVNNQIDWFGHEVFK